MTGGEDGTARLWDAFTGEVRATMRGHRGKIASVAFSENGRVAMTVGDDRTVRLWDAGNGEARAVIAEQPSTFRKVLLLSPDGRRLLTIYQDRPGRSFDRTSRAVVTLWDTGTGQRISNLSGHAGQVNAAAFSPDAKMVLTGGADKTARLWSADSGGGLATLQGIMGVVGGVAFNPEGDVATTLEYEYDQDQKVSRCRVRWWDPHRAVQIGPACFSNQGPGEICCFDRDVAVVALGSTSTALMFVQGMEDAIELESYIWKADNDYLLVSDGRLLDRRSGKRRAVPAGRRFSNDLARFATDGRFFVSATRRIVGQGNNRIERSFIDLRTGRAIGRTNATSGDLRHVPDRKAFVVLSWPSPRYIPIPDASLDAEVAQLFAEVVTCHELDSAGTMRPLDEATWDERRKLLVERVGQNPSALPVRRIATDPWHWLRRKLDGAKTDEEKVQYLDRLITVEPTWQNYERRALIQLRNERREQAARDFLEAGKRAGNGYWHDTWHWSVARPHRGLTQLAGSLVRPATRSPKEYALGLRLAEALSGAMPEDRKHRMLLAIARYRTGRYAEALALLETWPQERQRAIVAQAGQYLMAPWVAPFLDKREPLRWDELHAMAFLAMAHHRLGHREQARAALAELRQPRGLPRPPDHPEDPRREDLDAYQEFLREAEGLIEGKPPPGK